MNTMSWKDAMSKVRSSYLAEVYQKRGKTWFKYSKDFGPNIDVEEVDKCDIPREVKNMRKIEGCDTIFTNGMFTVVPVTKGCHRDRVVIHHHSRSDAAAVGEAVGGLLRGLFK